MRLHEGVLCGLFGVLLPSGDQVGGAKRDRLVLLHEGSVGAAVAAPRPLYELPFATMLDVVQWPALHRFPSTPRGAPRFPEP